MNPVYMLKAAALRYMRGALAALLLALCYGAAFFAVAFLLAGCGAPSGDSAEDPHFDSIEIDTAVDCSLLPLAEARCCVCEALGGTDCVALCDAAVVP